MCHNCKDISPSRLFIRQIFTEVKASNATRKWESPTKVMLCQGNSISKQLGSHRQFPRGFPIEEL